MKLQKTTSLWLVFALTSGAWLYLTEFKDSPKYANIQSEKRRIFNFKVEDIQQLTIETEGKIFQLERTQDRQDKWQIKQPENALANDSVVAFLLNLLAREKIERTFTVSADRLNLYHLQSPRGIIRIILNNQQEYQLFLGKSDFENKFIYARVDPIDREQKAKIILISKNFQYAILERSLADWQS